MTRLHPGIFLGVGVFLIAGIAVLAFFVLLKPGQEELADLRESLAQEEQVASRLESAQAEYERVLADWEEKQAQLQELRERRSIPISMGHPVAAMVMLWYEYRHDLPPLIEEWVEASGCTIESGASFPAPPMTPPQVPSSGFMPEPSEGGITLTVSGTLTALERLYRSLDQFSRVVTVSQLVIEGTGDELRAQVPLKFYLLVEQPPGAAAPSPAAPTGEGGEPGMPPLDMMDEDGGQPPELEEPMD